MNHKVLGVSVNNNKTGAALQTGLSFHGPAILRGTPDTIGCFVFLHNTQQMTFNHFIQVVTIEKHKSTTNVSQSKVRREQQQKCVACYCVL